MLHSIHSVWWFHSYMLVFKNLNITVDSSVAKISCLRPEFFHLHDGRLQAPVTPDPEGGSNSGLSYAQSYIHTCINFK